VTSVQPIAFREASAFVRDHHRHHPSPQGWKWGISLTDDADQIVGVAMAGRPVARMLDNGRTIEVTRVCTLGGPNACSRLYGAARRIAREMGYESIVTYTQLTEPGTSLIAAGWLPVAIVAGQSWDRAQRQRTDRHIVCDRLRWEGIVTPDCVRQARQVIRTLGERGIVMRIKSTEEQE